jgi:glycosyltransferase involved in cell wall biosynthesis
MPDLDLCVCVPARNEADRLPVLLDALAGQSWKPAISVSIAVNNSTDNSLAVIEKARRRHAGRLDMHFECVEFPPHLAHAGSARRLAMENGLARLPRAGRGVLVSTDADASPPADWLVGIVRAIGRGADIVGGRIEIDPGEPLPPAVNRLRETWDRYWQRVRAIEDYIDPRPWDQPPRHGDHTGASLAITADLYARCGGVPLLASGEDLGLVTAALAHGGRLAHPADVFTFVSPRLEGRAIAGMAAAIQELFDLASRDEAARAPAFSHWQKRAIWRRRLRTRPDGGAMIAMAEPRLPPMPHDMVLEIVS